jgi:hypothetical protein
MKRSSRKPLNLSDSVHRRLNVHALAGNLVPASFRTDAARAPQHGLQGCMYGLPSSHARRFRGPDLGCHRTNWLSWITLAISGWRFLVWMLMMLSA